ncbi:hypothetical protein QAD02_008333 [Eretmocerus hayati]|uniref:Uncharacterized protein n=1 Tax=Eretmocerus hayati TaxID=131215 RepID=A0ACC2N7K9_9HYME|nr:hypothetical protein QAD02_008333 [Eretmocerus hayati]
MLEQAAIAIENEWEHVKSIEAVHVAANLPGFGPSDSFVQDPIALMHGSDLGISKKMTMLFLDEKYSDEPWNVSAQSQKQIDQAIGKISPPDSIIRIPRFIEHKKHWKVSDYKDLALFYLSILLMVMLPRKYY